MWFRPAYPAKGPEPDIEVGPAGATTERPELRWAFIRKVYSIVSLQMLLTIAVGATVVYYRPIAYFFVSRGAGLGLYILTFLVPFLVLPFLYLYHQRHPWNMLLLSLFTVAISFAVGLTCAFTSGKVILESVMLTAVVVISLTLYTFWAARRGHDFRFLGPFLFAAIMILCLCSHSAFLANESNFRIHLRRIGSCDLLRLHHLRHRQPDEALYIRRIRMGRNRSISRHHQPISRSPDSLQSKRGLELAVCLYWLCLCGYLFCIIKWLAWYGRTVLLM